jgi:hypothetical protein
MGMKMAPLPKSIDSLHSISPLKKIKPTPKIKSKKGKPNTYVITGDIVTEPYQIDENPRVDSIKTE